MPTTTVCAYGIAINYYLQSPSILLIFIYVTVENDSIFPCKLGFSKTEGNAEINESFFKPCF